MQHTRQEIGHRAPVAPGTPQVSVVIPMHDEEGAVADLISGIAEAAAGLSDFEIIAVDDGSSDRTFEQLVAARASVPQLRILRHARAGGQSAAVHSGVRAARAAICCTLDGDGQNPPSELPKLWEPLLADESGRVGLVAGQRLKRRDTFSKRMGSKFANGLRRRILSDGTSDTGCGLKGFRTDAFLALPYFNHMHRYLPALFKAYRWEVVLVEVAHMERTSGRSKYTNFGRAVAGVADLIGVFWLLRRAKSVTAEETAADA